MLRRLPALNIRPGIRLEDSASATLGSVGVPVLHDTEHLSDQRCTSDDTTCHISMSACGATSVVRSPALMRGEPQEGGVITLRYA